MKLHYPLLFLVFLPLCYFTAAQPGQLDPDFGEGQGIVQFAMANQKHTQGGHIAIQPDGRLLVLGSSWTPNEPEYAFLARFKDDGTTDSTFNGTGKMIFNPGNGETYDGNVRVTADGRILVVIMASTQDGPAVHIHRLLPSGLPDPSFHGDGFAAISLQADYMNLDALALQPDGSMILAGYARFENEDVDHLTVLRLTSNGDLDPGFHGDGISSLPVGESYLDARSILVQPDGKLIAAGYAVFGGEDDVILVRLLPNGSVDNSFGQQGIVRRAISIQEDRCYAAALQDDGAIVVGGYAYNVVSGETEFAAARFLPDGSPDLSFDDDGVKTITISGHADGLRSMVLQPDDKIVLAGYVHSDIPGGSDMAVVRLNTTGTLDMTFDEDGIAILETDVSTSTTLHHIALQTDGRIVGTGRAWKDGSSSMFIARLISGNMVNTNESPSQVQDLHIHPNPAHDEIHITYTMDRTANLAIYLYDFQGRMIQEISKTELRNSGFYQEEYKFPPHVMPGAYVIRFISDRMVKTTRVILQ